MSFTGCKVCVLVLRAAPGVWKQPESLQRQGPNLARGGSWFASLCLEAAHRLLCLLLWCGILEYSLLLRPMCDTFPLSDSHTNRRSVAMTSNYLSPPAALSPFIFYFLSKMITGGFTPFRPLNGLQELHVALERIVELVKYVKC